MADQTKQSHTMLSSYFTRMKMAQETVSIDDLHELFLALRNIRKNRGMLFVAGNGGSASTSQHFTVDLGVGGLDRESVIRCISLTDNQSAVTAVANDRSFEAIFSTQLSVLAEPHDALLVISASGNSKNLLNAVHEAKKLGLITLGLLGFDGGKLRELCDISVLVSTNIGEYGIVEDVHLSICHNLTEALRSTP